MLKLILVNNSDFTILTLSQQLINPNNWHVFFPQFSVQKDKQMNTRNFPLHVYVFIQSDNKICVNYIKFVIDTLNIFLTSKLNYEHKWFASRTLIQIFQLKRVFAIVYKELFKRFFSLFFQCVCVMISLSIAIWPSRIHFFAYFVASELPISSGPLI